MLVFETTERLRMKNILHKIEQGGQKRYNVGKISLKATYNCKLKSFLRHFSFKINGKQALLANDTFTQGPTVNALSYDRTRIQQKQSI